MSRSIVNISHDSFDEIVYQCSTNTPRRPPERCSGCSATARRPSRWALPRPSLGEGLHRAAGRDPADAGGEYARDLPGPRVGKTGSTLARSLRVLILSQGHLSKAPVGLGAFEFLSVLDEVPGSVALRIVQRGVCTKV